MDIRDENGIHSEYNDMGPRAHGVEVNIVKMIIGCTDVVHAGLKRNVGCWMN